MKIYILFLKMSLTNRDKKKKKRFATQIYLNLINACLGVRVFKLRQNEIALFSRPDKKSNRIEG